MSANGCRSHWTLILAGGAISLRNANQPLDGSNGCSANRLMTSARAAPPLPYTVPTRITLQLGAIQHGWPTLRLQSCRNVHSWGSAKSSRVSQKTTPFGSGLEGHDHNAGMRRWFKIQSPIPASIFGSSTE
ncbi:hypothetical protein B0H19DRAFT_1071247 [Mycena capillaripes]|nr:hypothetical protein B0H19DRAFT_1071247 [Mycena capillaripes]